MSSERLNAAAPHATPTATKRPMLGWFQARYANQSTNAVVRTARVSERSEPSSSQRFGYTAARAAAMMPTRAPTTSRPRRPMTTTVAVPATQVQIRCASGVVRPSNDGSAR